MSEKKPTEEDRSPGWMDRAKARKEEELRRAELKKVVFKFFGIILAAIAGVIGGAFGLKHLDKINAEEAASLEARHKEWENLAAKQRAEAKAAEEAVRQKEEDEIKLAQTKKAEAERLEDLRVAAFKKEMDERYAAADARREAGAKAGEGNGGSLVTVKLEDGQLDPKNGLKNQHPVFLIKPKGYPEETGFRLTGWHGSTITFTDVATRHGISLAESELDPGALKILSGARDLLRRQIGTLQAGIDLMPNGNRTTPLVFAERGFLLSSADTGVKETAAYACGLRIQSSNTTYTVDFPVLIRTFWCGAQGPGTTINGQKGAVTGCTGHLLMEDYYKTITNKPSSHFTTSVRRCGNEGLCLPWGGRFKGYAVVIFNLTTGKPVYRFGTTQEILDMMIDYPVPKESSFIEGKLSVTSPPGTPSRLPGVRPAPMPGNIIR